MAAIVRSSSGAVIAKNIGGILTAWSDGTTGLYGYDAAGGARMKIELTIPADWLIQ